MQSETTDIAVVDELNGSATTNHPVTPMEMLGRAIERGVDADTLDKLMALKERFDAAEARKAFDAAMSEAKAKMPVIHKGREVDFVGKNSGLQTNYRFEDMGIIAKTVDPILSEFGLSYRFRTEQHEGGAISVTCIVSHRDGHSEENTLTAGRDETGNKNNLQQVGSTITYLQRYTLKAALGLAASEDTDGARPDEADTISEEQRDEILDRASAIGAGVDKLCRVLRVDAIQFLPQRDYERALEIIKVKELSMSRQG